jgi:glycosyltransferase EpsE
MSAPKEGTPFVSVLMGVYNCADTLGASVESILDQDYRNLELVVCDDGSQDRSAELLRAYAEKDRRIVFLQSDRNRGLAHSLNRCMEAAGGEYLARMDGDDISRPERIGRQVAFLEAHPEMDICGSSVLLFDSTGTWGKHDYPERPSPKSFLFKSPFVHPSVMFRASCLRAAGGYDEDPALGRSEDYDLFMRLYASGSRGYNIQDYLLEYREELGTYRRRKFRYALTEARVRARGFYRLGLLPLGLPYIVKPIVIGLFPKRAYTRARKALFGGER